MICQRTGKTGYTSRVAAARATKHLGSAARPYRCIYCGDVHEQGAVGGCDPLPGRQEARTVTAAAQPAQTEAQFQAAVIDYARLNRWLVYHTHDSRRSAPGFPDLVMVRDGLLILAELKTEKGRVSRAQTEWLEALYSVTYRAHEAAGFQGIPIVRAFVFRPSDWETIERVLGQRTPQPEGASLA